MLGYQVMGFVLLGSAVGYAFRKLVRHGINYS
jgi:hypothetical protein